jgi:RNA polymerase sigma-70 factor (ECF subfamily)
MLRFKHGDRQAFTDLVERNTEKIHALIYRFLGDPGMLEDLTQEVFLRVYRTAARYEPTAKFSTWLYRIVANLSFNVLRDRKKGHALQLDGPGGDDDESFYRDVPDRQAAQPHQRIQEGEQSDMLARALDQLPENQKVAIILNKYEHKNYEEIAEILNCSTMAVKSLLSRARSNLQESLRVYLKNA